VPVHCLPYGTTKDYFNTITHLLTHTRRSSITYDRVRVLVRLLLLVLHRNKTEDNLVHEDHIRTNIDRLRYRYSCSYCKIAYCTKYTNCRPKTLTFTYIDRLRYSYSYCIDCKSTDTNIARTHTRWIHKDSLDMNTNTTKTHTSP